MALGWLLESWLASHDTHFVSGGLGEMFVLAGRFFLGFLLGAWIAASFSWALTRRETHPHPLRVGLGVLGAASIWLLTGFWALGRHRNLLTIHLTSRSDYSVSDYFFGWVDVLLLSGMVFIGVSLASRHQAAVTGSTSWRLAFSCGGTLILVLLLVLTTRGCG
jgi:hypothetical protein